MYFHGDIRQLRVEKVKNLEYLEKLRVAGGREGEVSRVSREAGSS